jgi:hypothetical protein
MIVSTLQHRAQVFPPGLNLVVFQPEHLTACARALDSIMDRTTAAGYAIIAAIDGMAFRSQGNRMVRATGTGVVGFAGLVRQPWDLAIIAPLRGIADKGADLYSMVEAVKVRSAGRTAFCCGPTEIQWLPSDALWGLRPHAEGYEFSCLRGGHSALQFHLGTHEQYPEAIWEFEN